MAAGDIPISPPLIFCWLDDADPAQRAVGMEAGLYLLARCHEVRVYGPPTAGMRAELGAARAARIPIRWITEDET